jgi:cell wall-associated NlpC family hydrolase
MDHSLTRQLVRAITLVAALVGTPESNAAAQQPIKALQEMSVSALSLRDSVVAVARAQIGRQYVMGGTTPKRGFDCSGLVQYVLAKLSIDLPRTASAQARTGRAIVRDTTALRPGDLLLFGKASDGVSHIGIYVGNGRYIHASSIAGRVIESPINRPPSPLVKVLQGVRRVLTAADTLPRRVIASESVVPATITSLIAARQKQ